jgi:hypothetical protein
MYGEWMWWLGVWSGRVRGVFVGASGQRKESMEVLELKGLGGERERLAMSMFLMMIRHLTTANTYSFIFPILPPRRGVRNL